MNLENMMIRWISGEGKILNFLSVSGNVAERWKFYPAHGLVCLKAIQDSLSNKSFFTIVFSEIFNLFQKF